MIKKVYDFLSSMKLMAILMFIFAVAIGSATFIENDFGTQTAKAVVYNASWFNFLLALLTLNLVLNMYRYKMYTMKKPLVFLFHAAFIIILIGSAITRYVGYEGVMHIREGQSENMIVSSASFIEVQKDEKNLLREPIYLSKITSNNFDKTIEVDGKKVHLQLEKYMPNASYTIVPSKAKDAEPMIKLMITGGGAPERIILAKGDVYQGSNVVVDFDSGKMFLDNVPVIKFYMQNNRLKMAHSDTLNYLKMNDQSRGVLQASQDDNATIRTLYSVGNTNVVLRDFLPSAKKELASSDKKLSQMPRMRNSGIDGLKFKITSGNEVKDVVIMGQKGIVSPPKYVQINGVGFELSYGGILYKLPFALKLRKFELQRYPGSNSPMSYASEVTLIDKNNVIEENHRIYMNHVLEYKGYRFFQSSYDRDEHGTVLSVNHDPGTLPTYIGYFLLALGLYGSLLTKNGRFQFLMKKAKKAAKEHNGMASLFALFIALSFMVPSLHAKENSEALNPMIKTILSFNKTHADKFGHLIAQDMKGRMKPLDSLDREIVQKIARTDTILGLDANQIVLGMVMRPELWREIKMITTSHKAIDKLIGIDENEKKASFSQFFEYPDQMSGYKLSAAVNEAIRKAPAKRDKFDNAVLKVDERVNVAYMVYAGSLLKIFPKPADINNKWYSIIDAIKTFDKEDSDRVRQDAVNYFTAIDTALHTNNWTDADKALAKIDEYQKFYGAAVYPDANKVKLEIFNNNAKIFEHLWPLYFLVGFILLFFALARIVNPKIKIGLAQKSAFYLIILFFIAHTIGLAIRWYISGHAPWSNGYESMVYIAWATVFAGFIFAKTSPITLAATSILAGLILFVAHLNWLDPQVTNLVPVLQSYWLSIHVSMITASYGFLGLGALLGFITLILFIFMNENNKERIGASIKELNTINEMSLIIGLVMITVGNFLGGVWANESWGRYWSWDPKETWALVTILIYAIVVHLRFIKALYTQFMYSMISLLAFTSVLMTYFGVNYYLAGMHSYAKGDPVPVPDFVPLTYAIVFVIIILAARNRKLV